jgi:hypothetical protein
MRDLKSVISTTRPYRVGTYHNSGSNSCVDRMYLVLVDHRIYMIQESKSHAIFGLPMENVTVYIAYMNHNKHNLDFVSFEEYIRIDRSAPLTIYMSWKKVIEF